MFTLERKVDLVMQYIATADKKMKGELKKAIIEALNSESSTEVAKPSINQTVNDAIFDILKNCGVGPHLIGYKYITTAIQLSVFDRSYLEQVTSRLYPDVAKCYGSTGSKVERAIRHAIESAFDRGNLNYIMNVFGYTMSPHKGKLTNSEFISCCVNEITHTFNMR